MLLVRNVERVSVPLRQALCIDDVLIDISEIINQKNASGTTHMYFYLLFHMVSLINTLP